MLHCEVCWQIGYYSTLQSTVQCRDKRPKICVRHACAQSAYTRLRLSVRAFPTRLISMINYCPLRVLILLLVLAAVHHKSMAR